MGIRGEQLQLAGDEVVRGHVGQGERRLVLLLGNAEVLLPVDLENGASRLAGDLVDLVMSGNVIGRYRFRWRGQVEGYKGGNPSANGF